MDEMTANEMVRSTVDLTLTSIRNLVEKHDGDLERTLKIVVNAAVRSGYHTGKMFGYEEGWNDHKNGRDQRTYGVHVNNNEKRQ